MKGVWLSMPANFPRQYELMYQKGTSDLALATHALAIDDAEIDAEIIFFHLQQAAEKYLKALLSFHGVHYEKIHDIRRLIELCQANSIELPNQAEALVDLNPFAVEGRYSVIADDMYDAKKFIDLLREMKGYVAIMISKIS
jgi:HEPN domain-containing protein